MNIQRPVSDNELDAEPSNPSVNSPVRFETLLGFDPPNRDELIRWFAPRWRRTRATGPDRVMGSTYFSGS